MTRVAILGAAGKMGGALIRGLEDFENLALVAAVDQPGIKSIGEDSGIVSGTDSTGVKITDSLQAVLRDIDVAIDFTTSQATCKNAEFCYQAKVPMVIGTTGLEVSGEQRLREISKSVPIVYSSNYSLGVNLIMNLVESAAEVLGDSVDVEIVEYHHSKKIDSPSGTALSLGENIVKILGKELKKVAEHGRFGSDVPRKSGTIGFHAIRGGDIVGEHKVMFIAKNESIEITHKARTRDNFASGALRAAEWVSGIDSGFYGMDDVLGKNLS